MFVHSTRTDAAANQVVTLMHVTNECAVWIKSTCCRSAQFVCCEASTNPTQKCQSLATKSVVITKYFGIGVCLKGLVWS